MQKRKRTPDINVIASNIASETTADFAEEPAKDPHAVALGRKGGLKGGKARANKLTPEQRKEIAKKAAQKRWDK